MTDQGDSTTPVVTKDDVTEDILDLDNNFKDSLKKFIIEAFNAQTSLSSCCDYIKAKIQEKEDGKWNIVIGRDFATDVVHISRRYGLFKLGELRILIWQSENAPQITA